METLAKIVIVNHINNPYNKPRHIPKLTNGLKINFIINGFLKHLIC